jgi:hypothetical protein
MSDPMKNPDTDEEHRRRREAGGEDDGPDGLSVANAIYGGRSLRSYSTDYETEPTPEEDGTTDPKPARGADQG